MIKVQTLSPPESSSAATTGKTETVTSRPSATHAAAIPAACTNRRIEPIEDPPVCDRPGVDRTPAASGIDQLMDAVAALHPAHRGTITKL
jgi:hypothetical protein